MADIRLRSCSSLFYHHLGNFCDEAGEHESAIANYQKALLLSPDEAKTHCNLGHVLMKLGDYETARTHLRRAIGFKPNYFSAHSNLLWMLSFYGENIETEYVAEAKRYGQLVMAAAKPFTQWNRSVQRPDGRIRVGFVSGDLRAHPIGYFLAGVVGKLNHEKLELIAYSMNPRDDEITERIKRGFSEWHVITELNDQAAAHKIHTDGVDILIDITGHAGNNRLPVFAWKPAPVQVGWFAYLASTGVPGIDYVLADAVAAPATVRDQFTEEIWLLPETFNCFMPPDDHPLLVVAPAPALHNGYVTFGSCQRLNKLDDSSLQLWGQVLHALPQSRLRIQNSMLDVPNIRNQFQARLVSAGIPLARCILHGAIADRADHLAAHAQVDIVLDTVRYPGTTTTCEALWMGVPTLTLAGRTLLQRVGASVMTCAGLPDWVAEGEAEYVTLAVKHASNVTRLAKLRAGLREQVAATSLFDAARFAPQLEDALIGIWQRKMACLIG